MNRTQLIQAINDAKIFQNADWEEMYFPDEIEYILERCEILADGLDVEKHRWYETSVTVYELLADNLFGQDEYELFGIRYATNIFSEQMGYHDIYHVIEAFPMKEMKTITYVKED